MDPLRSSRSRSWAPIVLVAAGSLLSAQDAARSGSAVLRRITGSRTAPDGTALRTGDGDRVGAWRLEDGGALLNPLWKGEVAGPRLQRWLASPDGRTLAGIGDPLAPEHPFELQVAVLRDGRLVATLDERLGMESEITVGAGGTVAIAGHRAGERGQPFALALRADGTELYRHALPEGTLARDPVLLFDDALLVRTHGVLDEGTGGAILRVDEGGVRTLLEVPGALALVGFPGARVLVQTRESLTWFDAFGERVLWRRPIAVRPAGAHAWALWPSVEGEALAVVTGGLRRRGGPEPSSSLELFDARDGQTLGSLELDATGPPAEVDLRAAGDRLLVDWKGAQEVFTWQR